MNPGEPSPVVPPAAESQSRDALHRLLRLLAREVVRRLKHKQQQRKTKDSEPAPP